MSTKEASSKTLALSAALALTACLSGAALYSHWSAVGTSEELSDARVRKYNAEGYAGFHYFHIATNWDNANRICRDHGMVLATADWPDKVDRIHGVSGGRHVWLGYRVQPGHQANKNAWRWQSGAATHWARWHPGEPNNDGRWPNEWCAELYGNKHMNNLHCSQHRTFVCDKSPYADSYAMHGVNGAGYTWDEAASMCRIRYGTALATLGYAERMHQLMHHWQWPTAWVGLRITPGWHFHEGHFHYASGSPRRFGLRWAPHEPNNWQNTHEFCVHILHHHGRLNDLPCHARLRNYICDLYNGNSPFLMTTAEHLTARRAHRGWAMPAKLIDYRWRRNSYFTGWMIMHGVTPHWTNIFRVGESNAIRSPAFWQYHSYHRMIHYRQRSNGNWNEGCDPGQQFYPGLHHWFRVDMVATPGNFRVHINGHQRCHRPITSDPIQGVQRVWISDPWHTAAPMTISNFILRAW